MKSQVLSILTFLTICIGINAQNVNIPDAFFKNALVTNTAINTNGDSEISVAEAAAYTDVIDLANKFYVSDLTGIEAFVNLKYLYCWNNRITSLDLSANTALEQLLCGQNDLTSLDVSANTALTKLRCADNNIETLDVSLNIALTELQCHNNDLTSLKVASGYNTNITFFKAINNQNLTCIEVDNVAWSTTNWTQVDGVASFSTNCGTSTPTIYVNHAATGANDGTSWADAYTDLQDALVSTTFSNVWVAKGTYKPTVTADRDASFVLRHNVYGGFDGTEVNLSDRDLSLLHTTNETIFDGDLSGNDNAAQVVFSDALKSDNSYHVVEVFIDNLEINGVTIQNGHADATSGDNRFGGGIFKKLNLPNLTVKNCIIKNNIAFLGAGLSLSSNDTSNIIIDACIIDNNLANAGAGLDVHMSAQNKELTISVTNSLFKNNKTTDDTTKSRNGAGAAAARLRAYFSGVTLNATIVNNTFVNNSSLGNTAGATGNFPVVGISKNSGDFGNITVANNIFWGNVRVNSQTAPAIGKSSNTADAFDSVNSTKIVTNNTDEGNLSTISGPTNTLSTNPNLDANFLLTSGSSAIDSGDNSFMTIALDLAANQRIFNTTIDRGAYEFGSTAPLSVNNFSTAIEKVSVFPNPTTSFLNIKMESNLKRAVIYSLSGAKVIETTSQIISTGNLKNGLYLIKIEAENGKFFTKKFMKK